MVALLLMILQYFLQHCKSCYINSKKILIEFNWSHKILPHFHMSSSKISSGLHCVWLETCKHTVPNILIWNLRWKWMSWCFACWFVFIRLITFVVVAGICLCLTAKWLPDSGGPAAPGGETPDRTECERPRAQTQASRCCWIPLHRRLANTARDSLSSKMIQTNKMPPFIAIGKDFTSRSLYAKSL